LRHAITSKLTIFYRTPVIVWLEHLLHSGRHGAATIAAERDMKIYLLLLLIGTLLTAIRFTSAPERPSETLPQ
jgi:hypothetical protein